MAATATLTAAEIIDRMHLTAKVTIQVRRHLCGGTPKNPDTIAKWIEAVVKDKSAVRDLAEQARRDMGTDDLTPEQISEMAKGSWNGFRSDEQGLFLEARCVKALLKESADAVGRKLGVWALKKQIAERMFVTGHAVYLGRGEPDGFVEGTIHLEDRFGGSMAALKRVDYVEAPRLIFHVRLLDLPYQTSSSAPGGKKIIQPLDMLAVLLHHGQDLGLGADRSQGEGTYDVESIEVVDLTR